MIYSPERKNNNQNQNLNAYFTELSWLEGCWLYSLRSSFITSDLGGPSRPLSCCPCLCWALTAYLFPFLVGQARPRPPSPCWPQSLRSQATARFHVRHSKVINILFPFGRQWQFPITCRWIIFIQIEGGASIKILKGSFQSLLKLNRSTETTLDPS
jgi:hypothetical protein